jgi:hypothetical protein
VILDIMSGKDIGTRFLVNEEIKTS